MVAIRGWSLARVWLYLIYGRPLFDLFKFDTVVYSEKWSRTGHELLTFGYRVTSTQSSEELGFICVFCVWDAHIHLLYCMLCTWNKFVCHWTLDAIPNIKCLNRKSSFLFVYFDFDNETRICDIINRTPSQNKQAAAQTTALGKVKNGRLSFASEPGNYVDKMTKRLFQCFILLIFFNIEDFTRV